MVFKNNFNRALVTAGLIGTIGGLGILGYNVLRNYNLPPSSRVAFHLWAELENSRLPDFRENNNIMLVNAYNRLLKDEKIKEDVELAVDRNYQAFLGGAMCAISWTTYCLGRLNQLNRKGRNN